MGEVLATAIDRLVSQQIQEHIDLISGYMVRNCSDNMSDKELIVNMTMTSMRISADIAVQLILLLLDNAGIVNLSDEAQLRRILLTSVPK